MVALRRAGYLKVRKASPCRAASGCLIFFLFLFTLGAQSQTQVGEASKSADPKASVQVDLALLGYGTPNRIERLTDGEASVSLNFLDSTHVLLTFDNRALFRRLPSCPPTHADRIVHAVVIDVVTGKTVKESDWYLHDRQRYVWPLGAGTLLLRKSNDLYVIDANLREQLLWSSHRDLLWVAVTPDASQFIVETAADPTPTAEHSTKGSSAKFEAQFIDVATLKPMRTVPLKQVVQLQGTRWGYEDLVKNGDVWLVRFGPGPTQRNNLARVRSQTVPNVLYSSSNSLLIGRCPAVGCRYSVSAFSLAGRRLWQQHWPDFHWLPTIARTKDNDRFAISALRILHATAPPALDSRSADNPFNPDIPEGEGFQQRIRVIDTATGSDLFTVGVHPAMMADQNFALSADGRKLASLQDSTLQIFELPLASKEQQAKFAELNSSLPVFALASSPEAETKTADASTPVPDPNFASSNSENAADEHSAPMGTNRPAVAGSEENGGSSEGAVPTFKVTTKAVMLDVVVTDKKGNLIHGLSQEDFHVTEDGKPQEIHYFQEETRNRAPEPAAPAPPSNEPKKSKRTNDFSNDAPATTVSNTLVLLDLLNTPSQDQEYAQQQLIKFLQSKPKDSQIALCTLSAGGSHLRLIQGFTADETRLLAAVNAKSRTKIVAWQESAKGTANAEETASNLAKEGRMSGFQGLASAIKEVETEQQGADTDKRVAITLQALISLSQYLSGVPGRKNVVWLSGSFPISLPSAASWDPSVENRNYLPLIKSVTNVLADVQVAVYPVDVRGLLGGGISAEMADASGGAPTSDSGPQDLNAETVKAPTSAMSDDQQALALVAGERASVMQVAAATGGKAFYNSNGIAKAIETAVEQGSNYYTLSYNPSNKAFDGRFRRIKLTLAQKGYTLHYRQGYFAQSEHDNAAELARSARAAAMQLGAPASRQLSFSVRVVPVGEKKKVDGVLLGEVLLASNKTPSLPAKVDAQHYTVDYSFNPADLSFQLGANGSHRSTLILMMTSFDREGRPLTAKSSAALSELPATDYKRVIGGKVSLHEEFDVPAHATTLRLGIQDQMNGHLGTVEFALPLPPAPKSSHELPEIEPD